MGMWVTPSWPAASGRCEEEDLIEIFGSPRRGAWGSVTAKNLPGALRGDGGLELCRPFLSPVKDSDQFDPFTANPVRDDVRGAWHNELACSEDPPRSAHFGLRLEELDRVQDPLRDNGRVLFGVLSDEIANGGEMTDCASGPDDFH